MGKKICVTCGTSDTPLWRKGPSGERTSCNACGIRWKREQNALKKKACAVARQKRKKEKLDEKKEKTWRASSRGSVEVPPNFRERDTKPGFQMNNRKRKEEESEEEEEESDEEPITKEARRSLKIEDKFHVPKEIGRLKEMQDDKTRFPFAIPGEYDNTAKYSLSSSVVPVPAPRMLEIQVELLTKELNSIPQHQPDQIYDDLLDFLPPMTEEISVLHFSKISNDIAC